MGLPSPYIWGGTNIQKRGKYVGDGKFSRTAWDTQPGVAPMIATIARLDPNTTLAQRET
jgi:lysozyme family protein